jgi:hypothetical protein
MDFLPLSEFRKCVDRYQGCYKVKSFTCWDQFLCMAFAQLTFRQSLRDIEACLRTMQHRLYHMGIRSQVSRNTLAHANATRNWRIYAEFAQILIAKARSLYRHEAFAVELENTVYALDATVIDLCLSLFPWAKPINQRPNRASIKLQTLLDLRGNIPAFIQFGHPGAGDARIFDELRAEPGSFYIMDRGYMDSTRLYNLTKVLAYFVIRYKTGFQWRRLYSHPVDKSTGLRSDQTIVFSGPASSQNYPDKLRRICYFDFDSNRHFTFLTNHFLLDALAIAKLYKCRWQVELFFKWIKQHLRIKNFYGTSENAVKTQVWIAVSVYVLVAIIKKQLGLELSLYTILQILSVTLFEKASMLQVLTNFDYQTEYHESPNQLLLFN